MRLLVVSHTNHFIGNVTTTTATVTGPEGLRALSGDEAVEAGLMPKAIDVHWHDLGGVSRRLTYVHGTHKEVLIVDPNAKYSDICDPTVPDYAHACPDDDYRYTWYEAPDGSVVKITCRETWYEIGQHKQTFEFTVTMGADGIPIRPLQMLSVGVPDADSPKHAVPLTDHCWEQFLSTTLGRTWYDPTTEEEREFRRELRREQAAAK